MTATPKNCNLRVRIDEALRDRLEAAANSSTHKLSMSQIIERGVILALDELAKMEASKLLAA